MEEKLLEILIKHREVHLTDLPHLIPEIKGELAIFLPVKKRCNPNILLLTGVSKEFIQVVNNLMADQAVIWKPQEIMNLIFDNSPIYTHVPLATNYRMKKSKKECWLPMTFYLA